MKRTVLILAAAALVLVAWQLPAQEALDWGGSLTTINTVQSVEDGSDEDVFENSEKLVLYLTSPIGRSWDFVGQLGVSFTSEPVFAVDLERLYLQNQIDFVDREDRSVEQAPGLLRLSSRFGRYRVSDPTGLVLNHTLDGAGFTVEGRGMSFAAAVGYTGLINKEFSSVSLSIQDSIDDEDDDVYLGPKRLLGRGTLAFPALVAEQNVTLGFAFQQDLRDPESVIEEGTEPAAITDPGGLVDTQYAIATIDGPIPGVTSLFYGFSYVFNTGRTLSLVEDAASQDPTGTSYQYKPIRAHLVQAEFDYYLPQFYSSAIGLGVIVGTGDDDYSGYVEGNTADNATMFTAATPVGQGAVFNLESGNATVAEVSYSLKPFAGTQGLAESLLARVAVLNFFRTAGSGPVSAADVDPAEDGGYLGTELDLEFRWRPFSDLGVGLTTGFLFANDQVLLDNSNSFDYVIRLNASLSF